MGRPSSYTEERGISICERVANGEFLAVICRDPEMPSLQTVYDWRDAHPEFSVKLARARDIGYEAIEGEMLAIADTPVMGVEKTTKATGVETKEGDALGHRKLQIETRMKMLMVWNPKRYAAAKRGDGDETGERTIVYNSPSAED